MNNDEFEATMRSLEVFHTLRIPDGSYPIIRVDGRGFSKFTKKIGLDKPFDSRFHCWICSVAKVLLKELGGIYGYTESDEISILLPRETNLFGREVEKLVSISAGMASACSTSMLVPPFTNREESFVTFDSRIVVCNTKLDVVDYFRWRQADAQRNCLNSYAFWELVKRGKSPRGASKILHGAGPDLKLEILDNIGIDFESLPGWQINGAGVYIDNRETTGYNPLTGEDVMATRRFIVVDENLPIRERYAGFLERIMEVYENQHVGNAKARPSDLSRQLY